MFYIKLLLLLLIIIVVFYLKSKTLEPMSGSNNCDIIKESRCRPFKMFKKSLINVPILANNKNDDIIKNIPGDVVYLKKKQYKRPKSCFLEGKGYSNINFEYGNNDKYFMKSYENNRLNLYSYEKCKNTSECNGKITFKFLGQPNSNLNIYKYIIYWKDDKPIIQDKVVRFNKCKPIIIDKIKSFTDKNNFKQIKNQESVISLLLSNGYANIELEKLTYDCSGEWGPWSKFISPKVVNNKIEKQQFKIWKTLKSPSLYGKSCLDVAKNSKPSVCNNNCTVDFDSRNKNNIVLTRSYSVPIPCNGKWGEWENVGSCKKFNQQQKREWKQTISKMPIKDCLAAATSSAGINTKDIEMTSDSIIQTNTKPCVNYKNAQFYDETGNLVNCSLNATCPECKSSTSCPNGNCLDVYSDNLGLNYVGKCCPFSVKNIAYDKSSSLSNTEQMYFDILNNKKCANCEMKFYSDQSFNIDTDEIPSSELPMDCKFTNNMISASNLTPNEIMNMSNTNDILPHGKDEMDPGSHSLLLNKIKSIINL